MSPLTLPWSWRWDGVAAALLALVTFAARWAKASSSLYTVDSVLFSLATERYDLMALRPHPPGYPIFVALGKILLPVVGHDVNRAFVLEAALWSAGAVALLYALARAWSARRTSIAAAALFAVAPAFAFNGTIALSYTAEAAAMLGVALAAWHAWTRPTTGRLLALGAAWALAVGIRQSLLVFLAPTVLFALLPRPLVLPVDVPALARRTAIAAVAALITALAWFLPMAWASGGIAEVRRATRLQTTEVVLADAVWRRGPAALGEHWDRLVFFLHWETAVLVPVIAVFALAGWAVRSRRDAPLVPGPWPRGAGWLMGAWLVPALLFYLVVFDGWQRGPIGYVLTILPGLYLLAVLLGEHGLRRLAAAQRIPGRRALAALTLPLLLLPLPGLASQGNALIAHEATAHDAWTKEWQHLAVEYPANSTAILDWQSWAHVKWYFPDHVVWTYFPTYDVPGKADWALVFQSQHHEDEGKFIAMYLEGPGRPEHPIPANIQTIVVFDFQLAGENGEVRRIDPAVNVTEAHLADGWRILVLHPDAAHPTVESLFTREALGAGARAKPPT